MTIDELESRLNKEFPSIYKCILINGEWGIGKTHFLKNSFLINKSFIYISLFGAESLESIKIEIYSKLNNTCKLLDSAKRFWKKSEGNSIGIGPISLPITYWETDINKAIEKHVKDKVMTIVIDDIERMSSEINVEDLLGMIENITEINNLNVILIANEDKISENALKKYSDFKEKVVQKTFIVTKYSKDAPQTIINHLLDREFFYYNIKRDEIINFILNFFEMHPVYNLRTLIKAVNFLKLVNKYIDKKIIKIDEFKDIITASLSITIEKTDNLYSKDEDLANTDKIMKSIIEESGDTTTYVIIKKYFFENYYTSSKTTLIKLLMNIYDDDNVELNFDKINKYYIDIHTFKKESKKELFFMSEEELREEIDNFYREYILKTNPSVDINNWFKKLNEIYYYVEILNLESIFNEDTILKAMDNYLTSFPMNNNLFYIIDSHIPCLIKSDKMIDYNKILNTKIAQTYYTTVINDILENMKCGIYKAENLDKLFSIFTEKFIKFDKDVIYKIIESNNYFIPDLNSSISDEIWGWCHNIWGKESAYKGFRDNKFEIYVKSILDNATTIGKHRIESLNKQYDIQITDS